MLEVTKRTDKFSVEVVGIVCNDCKAFCNLYENVITYQNVDGRISIIYEENDLLKTVNYINGDNTVITKVTILG